MSGRTEKYQIAVPPPATTIAASRPNFQRSSDEELDRACRAWELARDDDALHAAARAIQLRAAECLPLIPLFAPAAVWAHHRRVRGWRPNRHDLYPLYGDVWLADA